MRKLVADKRGDRKAKREERKKQKRQVREFYDGFINI